MTAPYTAAELATVLARAEEGTNVESSEDAFGKLDWACQRLSRLVAELTRAREWISELEAEAASEQPKHWTCFHCNETFTDWKDAGKHFGYRIDEKPAACIKHADARERALRDALRNLLDTTPEERQTPSIWFPRVDAARAALGEEPADEHC